MSLLKEKTEWVFMLPSSGSAAERHIFDIAIGISFLLKQGIGNEDIKILIDNTTPDIVRDIFGSLSIPDCFVYSPTKAYFSLFTDNEYENVVIFITGHGGINGLDCAPPIKPYPFFEEIKKAPCLKNAVVFFGQCEAGIFNYVSLDTKDYNNCSIVAIGGADLQESISTPRIISNGLFSANLFLSLIFFWLGNPIDIDGDGKFTIMDAFKYSTCKTNIICKQLELETNYEKELKRIATYYRLQVLEQEKLKRELTLDESLELISCQTYDSNEKFNQVPWILNAFPAMSIEVI